MPNVGTVVFLAYLPYMPMYLNLLFYNMSLTNKLELERISILSHVTTKRKYQSRTGTHTVLGQVTTSKKYQSRTGTHISIRSGHNKQEILV